LNKAPDAFRTISEVADDLDLPQHVLRFWETRFNQIKPMKRGGGRRYYRPEDVDLLRGIKFLLYEEGYTIRGLQRILKEQGNKFVIAVGRGEIEAAIEGTLLEKYRSDDELETASAPAEKTGGSGKQEEPAYGTGKKAIPVSELTGKKSKANLSKGSSRDNNSGASEQVGGLSEKDCRSLQSTLYELLECKRLLDQVRGN
jgi:DNA-binding transcriptional MerR regulator